MRWYAVRRSSIIIAFLYCLLQEAADLPSALEQLKHVYPDHIKEIYQDYIVWHDGTCMPLTQPHDAGAPHDTLNNPCLADQLEQPGYKTGKPESVPDTDPGRIRYEPFFRKMYGNSQQEVEQNLEYIPWMPAVFGTHAKILRVTRINGVHEKIKSISQELEALALQHPEYIPFLQKPGGTFCWRCIANTTRLSNHSFGMTLDINAALSHYWQWDLKKAGRPITEDEPLEYINTIPWDIVEIFEKYGFIWGGKWYHYDTMHFEYRPELIEDIL
jgi:peptidoglycan LD-endopeptidase CwlK